MARAVLSLCCVLVLVSPACSMASTAPSILHKLKPSHRAVTTDARAGWSGRCAVASESTVSHRSTRNSFKSDMTLIAAAGCCSGCPCSNETLCQPIQRAGPEEIYAFHIDGTVNGSLDDWKLFDWSRITTLCLYGTLAPELLCHAHAHNVRITLGNGGTGYDFTEPAVNAWVNATVQKVQMMFVDGINIDLEVSNCSGRIGNCDNPSGWSADAMANLTRATKLMADSLHAAVPGSHVSFDTPSMGLFEEGAGGRGCGYMYGR